MNSSGSLYRDSYISSPLLVSFSGLDGSGKTTQIERLNDWLTDSGIRVRVVKLWDDVAAMRNLREALGHALFGGERGVGTPGRPVRRRDKNVQSWYMLPVRMMLYALDGMALASFIARLPHRRNADVVIFDRYLYDQIANFDTSRPMLRRYSRWLLRIVPRPSVALVLDVDPTDARERKPEYPVEFLRHNRACYFAIAALARLKVIPPGNPEEVWSRVRYEFARHIAGLRVQPPLRVLTSRSG